MPLYEKPLDTGAALRQNDSVLLSGVIRVRLEGNMTARQLRLLLFVLAVLAVELSFAQAPTGTVAGTVTDATGAVVVNAPVSISNKETGASRAVMTGSDGSFS